MIRFRSCVMIMNIRVLYKEIQNIFGKCFVNKLITKEDLIGLNEIIEFNNFVTAKISV